MTSPNSSFTLVTHYTVLGVPNDSPISAIRSAYTSLILKLHPDKAGTVKDDPSSTFPSSSSQACIDASSSPSVDQPLPSTDNSINHDQFVQVQLAWEVLRDPERRKTYDDELRRLTLRSYHHHHPVYDRPVSDEIERNDLSLVETDDQCKDTNNISLIKYTYPCRCGDLYRISQSDIINRITLYDCSTCSLRIRIRWDSEDE